MYAGNVRVLVFVRTLFHKKNVYFFSFSRLFFPSSAFVSSGDDDVHRINYACISIEYIRKKTRKEIENT
jgi:hypothetical protein